MSQSNAQLKAAFYEEMDSKVKTTVVSFSVFSAYDFIPPATWFIKNAVGDYIFIHTRDRATAQSWVDEHYGKGRYTVNASKMQKGNGDVTCRGVATRKGQKKYN